MAFMTPPDTTFDLRSQRRQEIVFHGTADPVFSALDTIAWHERFRDATVHRRTGTRGSPRARHEHSRAGTPTDGHG